MGRGGAPDASLVWLAHDELVRIPAKAPTETFSLYVRLRAADIAAWRGFVALQPLFAEHGVLASGLHHSVNQADLMFVHFVGSAREKLDALPKRPEFQDWLRGSGMSGGPESFLAADVSRSRTPGG